MIRGVVSGLVNFRGYAEMSYSHRQIVQYIVKHVRIWHDTTGIFCSIVFTLFTV